MQLPTGDIVTVFSDIRHGHYTARPMDPTDTLLEHWHLANPVAGPLGSDMNAPWLGDDGLYRMVASCGPYEITIPYGEMCIFVSNDSMKSFVHQVAPGQPAAGVLHRYGLLACSHCCSATGSRDLWF